VHLAELCLKKSMARIEPDTFVTLCFRDAAGGAVEQSQVHSDLQAFLGSHPKVLVELPRDHGKSFQVCCRVLWELGRNPSLRVKMVCATEAVAAERSRFLRDAIANNAMVQHVFPKMVPGSPWAAEAFAVERAGDVIGPSVAAFGVGAGSTGTRADLLVCDDVVDVRALHSRAERERTAAYFHDNLLNLLEPDGRFWGLCTPWHPDDLNARLKANGSFALFRRAVGSDLEPVWPERWTKERLALRRAEIGAASFARGYHLLPVAEEETPIRGEWVRFWTDDAKSERVLLSVDPAVSASEKADASALVVLGQTGNDIRVLAASARRVSAPELVNLIDEFDRAWNPSVILFESNAAFLGIRDLLARHATFGPKLKGVTQTRDKAARVAAFSVVVESPRCG
jgi:phage terminase large subunit-like protein